MKPLLTIVGGGMGDPALLTLEAQEAIVSAARIFAPPRFADSLAPLNAAICATSIAEILEALQHEVAPATVVVSGDIGFFSFSSILAREMAGLYQLRMVNGISCLQYLCGRMRLPYQDFHIVSLHGRNANLIPAVSYHRWVFLLVGGTHSAESVLDDLCQAGLGHVTVTVGENLAAPDERIITAAAQVLAEREFSSLAALLVENPAPASPHVRLRDSDFIRHTTPMTKETVRTVSVARLNIAPEDTVWDIGAGTGSVSIALAYAAHAGMVYAVERDPEAAELIRQNREKFGSYNLVAVTGEAPAALQALPPPDKVFIGGSGGQLGAILEHIRHVASCVSVCINAITLETLTEANTCLQQLGFTDIEIACINASTSREAGSYHLMTAQNPVYILSGRAAR